MREPFPQSPPCRREGSTGAVQAGAALAVAQQPPTAGPAGSAARCGSVLRHRCHLWQCTAMKVNSTYLPLLCCQLGCWILCCCCCTSCCETQSEGSLEQAQVQFISIICPYSAACISFSQGLLQKIFGADMNTSAEFPT